MAEGAATPRPQLPTGLILADVGRRAFSSVDRRSIVEWAEENVVLGPNYTITGQFRLTHSRYLAEPFSGLQADNVRVVSVRAPVRSGKSLMPDVWVLWIIANDPGPCMWNMQTDPMAKDHAKMRFRPNLHLCAPVVSLLPADRHDKNIQEIHFSNGMPLFIQGPSEGNLQGKGIRYLINDEYWCWDNGRIYQAFARTKDFDKLGSSKRLNISQGGSEGDDEDTEWGKGDGREWHVPCLGCGTYFEPKLEFNSSPEGPKGFVFDDSEAMRDEHGDWDAEAAAKTVRHVCANCGHVHPDTHATRQAWNDRGVYVPVGQASSLSKFDGQPPTPFPFKSERVSFHFESSVVRPWRQILEEYLYALNALRRGVVDQIKAWYQKERALPWSEMLLFTARPKATFDPLGQEEWKEEHVRFFTLDFQDEDVWWGLICAWSKRGEARRLWFGRITSESEIQKLQAEYKVKNTHVGMDCGFKTKRVYAMCARNGWIAFRGDHRPEFGVRMKLRDGSFKTLRRSYESYTGDPETGQLHAGRSFCWVIRWSNPTIKDRVSQHLARGLFVVPKTDAQDEKELIWNRQIAAEYKKQKRNPVSGRTEMIWVCPSGNNHLFDCLGEQFTFATVKMILPDIEIVPPGATTG